MAADQADGNDIEARSSSPATTNRPCPSERAITYVMPTILPPLRIARWV